MCGVVRRFPSLLSRRRHFILTSAGEPKQAAKRGSRCLEARKPSYRSTRQGKVSHIRIVHLILIEAVSRTERFTSTRYISPSVASIGFCDFRNRKKKRNRRYLGVTLLSISHRSTYSRSGRLGKHVLRNGSVFCVLTLF